LDRWYVEGARNRSGRGVRHYDSGVFEEAMGQST
jgi:hypothetical protein